MKLNRISSFNKNEGDSGDFCFTCGNAGFPDKECPMCGRRATLSSMNLDFREDTPVLLEKLDRFGIPGKYHGIMWDAEILLHSFPDKENDYAFQHYVQQLNKIHQLFVDGTISPKSAIIIAPAGYSKMTFAYSCMQLALDKGLTVAPFLDTLELKRLLVLAGENPRYKLNGKVDYDSYIMSDVLFVTVTKLGARQSSYEVIEELLDRRARKGLGTFVLSRFSLTEMSRRDESGEFEALTTARSEDSFKYPAVIRYSVSG